MEHCLLAHNVDKPYQCSECKETFASKATFRFHTTNTHKKREYIFCYIVFDYDIVKNPKDI